MPPVATALSEGESKRKHSVLLEVRGQQVSAPSVWCAGAARRYGSRGVVRARGCACLLLLLSPAQLLLRLAFAGDALADSAAG